MSPYWKTVFRTIRNSLGRFLAILAIIALGVGFYSGLSLTMPCFLETGNTFVRDHSLYDLRLISTIGFEEGDIEKISGTEGVRACAGAYLQDALVNEEDATVSVVRFHSLTDGINEPELTAGRLPVAGNEVVLDGYRCPDSMIGTTLKISPENDKDTRDAFTYDSYTVVGIIRSPYYLNFQRGTTDVGGGSINYYAYIADTGFSLEYFSECFVKWDADYFIYSDEEEALEEELEDRFEGIVEGVINERFDDLTSDYREEIDDARQELRESRDEALEELSDAKRELDDAREEIRDGQAELDDARQELSDAWDRLTDAQEELADALEEIEDGQDEIDEGYEALEEQEELLDEQEASLTEARDQLTAGIEEAQAARDDLELQLEYVTALGDEDSASRLAEGIAVAEGTLEELNSQLAEVNAGLEAIAAGRDQIEEAREILSDSQDELDAARDEYNEGLEEYQNGLNDYYEGSDEYNEGYDDLLEGIEEYNDGLSEYNDGLLSYQQEISMAYRDIGYAEKRLNELEEPKTYVLGRDTNVGYVSFDNDAHIVDGIAKVFPVFFFALAALVCSTTMQRMVADERGGIGTMRAMGYGGFAVMMKYVIYSGSASVMGCIGGYLGGIKLFPYVIWQVYGMMYGFAPIEFVSDKMTFCLSLAVSLICSVGVTVVTCLGEMRGMPAELIRPKAPPAGKRILLEKIPFIWRRLKFTHKVSIRNVFRFKKRMWMMILGIAGCTALLITGFGIKDSIDGIVDVQYDNILLYDISVNFKEDTSEAAMRNAVVRTDSRFGTSSDSVAVLEENLTHQGADAIRDVTLIVSGDEDILTAVNGLCDGNVMPWPDDGKIAISSKLASKAGIVPGDTITLGYGDMGETFTAEVQYVFDNYIFHYAFMNDSTYERMLNKEYVPDTLLVTRNGEEGPTDYDYASSLAGDRNVKAWSVVEESRASFRSTMQQLNKVVVLIIGCAAALAFIVLFNLNNINITERIREIATLKVLGFSRFETGSYVFRENFILVFLGFVFGIPLGIALHGFVMDQIEMDTVTFVVRIFPVSYFLSLGFVLLFSLTVDLIMRGKTNRIDMAESLKSIE